MDNSADTARAAIQALLWIGVCDQTWCVCLGPEDGDHLLVIHGWNKYADLPSDQWEATAAEVLYAAGWRAGMTIDQALFLHNAEDE